MSNAPLVGMHFRPPAKAILAALPMGFPLQLRPEPSNPYDPNAIAVWVSGESLKPFYDELELSVPGYGTPWEEFLATPEWHLGYMAKEFAALHVEDLSRIIEARNGEAFGQGYPEQACDWWPATLSFDAKGKYQITFEV
jgi:hypothetical protein